MLPATGNVVMSDGGCFRSCNVRTGKREVLQSKEKSWIFTRGFDGAGKEEKDAEAPVKSVQGGEGQINSGEDDG